MIRLPFYLLALSISIIACGQKAEKNPAYTTQKVEKSKKSCLNEYMMEPCSILSKEQIANLAGIDAALIEVNEPPNLKNPLFLTCTYRWDSDRKVKFKNALMELEVDQDNEVKIGSFKVLDPEKIKTSYVEYFNNFYKNMTEEQMKLFEEKLEEELKEETDETKTVGKSLSKMAMNVKYENFDGVGDRASWETNTKTSEGNLHVLHGDLTFSVVVNISDDVNVSLDLAKKVANKIVALCD